MSLPTNISEGSTRQSTKEFIRFLYISLGSSSELETLRELSIKLKIGSSERANYILKQLEAIEHKLLSQNYSLKTYI